MSPKPDRSIILDTDHLRMPQPLRTDYSKFEGPTAQARKWAREARQNRRLAAHGVRT